MRRSRWIAAALLAAVVAVKLLLPDVAAELRRKALAVFPDETDYRAVFETLGGLLSPGGGEESAEAPELLAQDETPEVRAQYTSYHIEEAAPAGEAAPEAETEAAAEAAPEEEAMPAAVTAFLESQAAFSGYALPAGVDYAYLALPFASAAPVAGYTSSGFGYRVHPILNDVRFHYGTDVAANTGEEVLAFADGTVSFAGEYGGYGNCIILDHGDGWTTLYAHCSALCAEAGRSVPAGEKIALVGATGEATGPHLHFELRHDGVYYNPEYYING